MKARVVARGDVLKIVDLLRAGGYEVLAPFRGHKRDTWFDTVTDQNRGEIQLHLPNPYYPPKRFVLPHIERLLKVRREDGTFRVEPTYEEPNALCLASAPVTWPASITWIGFIWDGSFATFTTRNAAGACSW